MLHSQVLHTSTSQRKQVSPTYSGWGSHSPEIACCCCWQNEEWHNEMSAGLLSVSQAHGVKHWVCPSVLALFSCFGSHLFHFSCQFLDVFSSSFPDSFSLYHLFLLLPFCGIKNFSQQILAFSALPFLCYPFFVAILTNICISPLCFCYSFIAASIVE